MLIKVVMKLMAEEKQPKHSVRYQFENGDGGLDTIYLKRSHLPSPPPQQISIRIEAE